MVRFELNLDEPNNKKMRDIFRSLVDEYVSYPQEDERMGYLKSIPSNYGYVFFWFGYLDEEALSKYYKDYLSKEKLIEIEEAKNREEYFSLEDNIRDELFPIVYDHSDTIEAGWVEVYLAILDPELEKVTLEKALDLLNLHILKLKKLIDFENKWLESKEIGIDIEIGYEKIKYADLRLKRELEKIGIDSVEFFYNEQDYGEDYDLLQYIHERKGWEICVKIDFNGDDTLKEVIYRIDKIISPLKRILNKITRYESSFFPF